MSQPLSVLYEADKGRYFLDFSLCILKKTTWKKEKQTFANIQIC